MEMTDKEFLEELANHPTLKSRFKEMLMIAANKGDKLITRADDAEFAVIDQVRKAGKELLQDWADKESNRLSNNVAKQMSNAKKHVKKTLVTHYLRRNKCNGTKLLFKTRRYFAPV